MSGFISLLIASIAIGILLGCAFAIAITANSILKSNDLGDSKGEFHDFASHPLTVRERQDNLPLPMKTKRRSHE